MLVEFASCIKNCTGKEWIETKCCIRYVILLYLQSRLRKLGTRCQAHVFHLAAQALISTYSKALFYDLKDAGLEFVSENGQHDEIGLVRAITVKAHSSAQREQLFKDIQSCLPDPCPPSQVFQLLLDMPICWSSTYFVDIFVYELGLQADMMAKQKKIDELMLTGEEWKRVQLFASLLAHADNAQQSFSSDKGCTLQHALPALEALHKAWTIHSDYKRYAPFKDGLDAATDKLAEYYNCTADSNAYTLSICKCLLCHISV
ncbi:hypothetical protein PAXRUDRAFT_792053 [Paxillus rubicundulus Ve08.2h10]|uniref:Uncharacterized protein n=1 Tax=Paxillus rubicundulus Ve08.2h10 TaxID=930991 RepID=A0A0D0D6Y8_9AGAM|nr:hypothetical protein PAXRUDRAFT_792053 [Paxillus rubicundulus Ve08.2h10]